LTSSIASSLVALGDISRLNFIDSYIPSRSEGRFAIVTNAGWDAVDVAVSLTNGTQADGEVVWS